MKVTEVVEDLFNHSITSGKYAETKMQRKTSTHSILHPTMTNAYNISLRNSHGETT